jgi:hypothetical protein
LRRFFDKVRDGNFAAIHHTISKYFFGSQVIDLVRVSRLLPEFQIRSKEIAGATIGSSLNPLC